MLEKFWNKLSICRIYIEFASIMVKSYNFYVNSMFNNPWWLSTIFLSKRSSYSSATLKWSVKNRFLRALWTFFSKIDLSSQDTISCGSKVVPFSFVSFGSVFPVHSLKLSHSCKYLPSRFCSLCTCRSFNLNTGSFRLKICCFSFSFL